MEEEGKSEELGLAKGFVLGVLVIVVGLALFVAITSCVADKYPCDAGRQLLERAEIRVMMEDEFSWTVCRFATDEGFVLYHDGQLYFEVGDGE